MIIKSELTGCKIELIDCFGEHQSQLFYRGIRVHNPCWNKYAKSQLDIQLGSTMPLDISDDYNEPVLCIPIHFFQRLNDKQGRQHRRTGGSGGSSNEYIHSQQNYPKSSLQNMDYNDNNDSFRLSTIKSNDDQFSHQITNSLSTRSESKVNTSLVNNALATIRIYFPVKLMKSANELKISSDLKKRFHLPPHLHEFVAYPELLTLPIDQLSICILKGLSTAHSLVQYTLPVPKELYNLKTSQLTHQIHNDNNDTNNMDDDDNSIRSQKVAENDGQTSLPSSSPSAEQDVVETRFLITSRGVYNRINALMQIRREENASSTGHRDLSIHQKFLDCNNLMKLSQHSDNTNLLTSSTSKELIDNEDIYANGSTNVSNSSDNINESMNNHRGVTNSCNGYLRDWVAAKLRRSRLRGTDHLVIKFKRDSLSRNYYPSELVPNSIAQYNEQSVNDTSCNTTATTITTSTPTIMGLNDNTTTSNANTTVTTPPSPSPPSHPATTTTTANNHNGSSDKRIRCEQNTVLCILTSPLNYSSAYNPRNTCYNSNRLLSPTTLTTSSIASRVKWGANLTLQSNSTSNYHDFNETKISYPMNQYQSEMSNKELSQHIVNGFNSLPTGIRKTSPDELDRIILHPRPRIPPKRLDLANQDLELALKRSLSDCTMRSPNNSYYNSSIKKSLPYTVRLKNQRNVNRDSTNKNLAHRRKTVIRPKRRRHRPFTSRRQKSKNGNIKSQHQLMKTFLQLIQ
ncbi:unnamed protein product [Heterobilharzia americana]|nr:unnamed protein product [Heterobilharzia americana]